MPRRRGSVIGYWGAPRSKTMSATPVRSRTLRAFVREQLRAHPELTLHELTWQANKWNLSRGKNSPITGTVSISERAVKLAARGVKDFS